MKYTGKCLCGEVTYTADAPPVVVAQCHCEECRRLSGTGHTVGAMLQRISEANLKHGRQTKGKLAAQRHATQVGRRIMGELKRIEQQTRCGAYA